MINGHEGIDGNFKIGPVQQRFSARNQDFPDARMKPDMLGSGQDIRL